MLKDTQHQFASPAEQCFSEALGLAKQQGALFWELRNALSLARLRAEQDRKTDASRILASAYGAFEGLEIADAREAKTLLNRLGAE